MLQPKDRVTRYTFPEIHFPRKRDLIKETPKKSHHQRQITDCKVKTTCSKKRERHESISLPDAAVERQKISADVRRLR